MAQDDTHRHSSIETEENEYYNTSADVHAKGEELMEVQNHGSQDGNQAEYGEAEAGTSEEEVGEDDTEGLRKSLKKGYKAVKHFFGRSSNQTNRTEPESTFEAETEQPQLLPALVTEDGTEYDFSHHKRGRAIIINNERFHQQAMLGSRPGSTKDAESFKEVFKKLGFDVKVLTDLTAFEIKRTLEREARIYDHQNADCLAVTILSHGDSEVLEKAWKYHTYKSRQYDDKVRRDIIFGVDGSVISTASVIRTFQDERCPGLQGKPRLFFFQACRGDQYDDGVKIGVVPDGATASASDDGLEETDAKGFFPHHRKCTISPAPIFKDFLVMYATTPGHFAWRRPSGTWFGQSIHEVFTKHLTSHMSLTQALTRVIRLVTHNFQSRSNSPSLEGKKQTPVIESMLTKDVFFYKK